MPRHFLKRTARLVALWLAAGCGAVADVPPARPNIVLVLTDDQGFADVSVNGPSDVQTPRLERLAREGLRFTAMRANATVCSPTRAALLTGLYPDRAGVPGVIRTDAANSWGHLRTDRLTLAGHLQRAGYHTALIGKWHLGLAAPNTPNERGFDTFQGFLGDMMDSFTTHRRHGQNYMRRNTEVIDPVGHATDLFTDWAVDYVRARAASPDRPFFLYLAYNAPHFPIEPPEDWLARVRACAPDLPLARARAVAFAEHLDAAFGRLLQALDETGLAQNTVVIYTSDNGGSQPHAQRNDPWRGGKQDHYDGGLRVPCVVRWPGTIAAGSVCDVPVLTFDFFPALLEAAGAAVPPDLDARSLLPLLRGEAGSGPRREFYFVRREGGGRYGGLAYHALIRDGWKLLRNDAESGYELYHLAGDPGETRDLAAREPARAAELKAALARHIQRGGTVPWQAAMER